VLGQIGWPSGFCLFGDLAVVGFRREISILLDPRLLLLDLALLCELFALYQCVRVLVECYCEYKERKRQRDKRRSEPDKTARGSKPKRSFVPGTRRKSSMMSASHRKRDSREALVRWLRDRSSAGRTSHSGTFDCRSPILDCAICCTYKKCGRFFQPVP
jgi:hypothetical protein